MTLTEFLLARIAEDERAARLAIDDARAETGHVLFLCDEQGMHVGCAPARVLAECEAKRRIVALATEIESAWDGEVYAHATLTTLAMPYADHPDYRDEWKHVVMPQDLGGDEVGAPDLWRGVVDVVAVPVVTSPPVDAEHPPADRVTLTEFLLARKHDEADQRIIGAWAQDCIDAGMNPAEAAEYQRRFERTLWAQAVRLGRAQGDLGWAIASTFAPWLVRREAARYADHPDYRDEWRP